MSDHDALLSLEEARGRVLAAIDGPLPAEEVPILDALGRVAATEFRATTDRPPWDNSAMDGYAVRSADVAAATDATPVRLAVIGEVRAGWAPAVAVGPGTAVRIATGAPLPVGADAVVPVEQTTPIDASGTAGTRGRDAAGPLPDACLVHVAVPVGGSIRRRGDDLAAGAVVLPAGVALTAAGVALAAGSGNATVAVHRRPRVAVLATGDEVRGPGEDLGPAGIPDANRPGLLALARANGCETVDLGVAHDDLADVTRRMRGAVGEADVVIVSGGVSVGPYDVVRTAFEAVGRVDLWRVAIQPGKPFAFGVAEGERGRSTLLFGLPGNPVSTFVTFELFARPALRRLAGHRELLRAPDRGVLDDEVRTSPGRRAFIRVVARRASDGSIRRDERGRAVVGPAGGQAGQGSHVLSALAAAEALAIVPEALDVALPGQDVEVWWLDRP